jgi:hypothetical protein
MSSISPSTSNQESQTSTAAPSATGTSSSNTTAAPPTNIPAEGSEEENAETEKERQEREKQEAMFEFMVGNYCVRRFLDSAEKALSSFSSSTSTPPQPTNPPSKQAQLSKLRRKLRKRFGKSLKQRVQVTEVDVEVEEVILDQEREVGEEMDVEVEVRETPQPRRMMFGEIPPTSLPPSGSSEEKPLMAPKRKVGEGWEDGLFWYYRQPLLSPTSDTQSPDDGNDERDEDEDEGEEVMNEKVQKRSCFTVLKRGFGILSRRMGALFSSRCLGRGMRGMRVGIRGFRALEG